MDSPGFRPITAIRGFFSPVAAVIFLIETICAVFPAFATLLIVGFEFCFLSLLFSLSSHNGVIALLAPSPLPPALRLRIMFPFVVLTTTLSPLALLRLLAYIVNVLAWLVTLPLPLYGSSFRFVEATIIVVDGALWRCL